MLSCILVLCIISSYCFYHYNILPYGTDPIPIFSIIILFRHGIILPYYYFNILLFTLLYNFILILSYYHYNIKLYAIIYYISISSFYFYYHYLVLGRSADTRTVRPDTTEPRRSALPGGPIGRGPRRSLWQPSTLLTKGQEF